MLNQKLREHTVSAEYLQRLYGLFCFKFLQNKHHPLLIINMTLMTATKFVLTKWHISQKEKENGHHIDRLGGAAHLWCVQMFVLLESDPLDCGASCHLGFTGSSSRGTLPGQGYKKATIPPHKYPHATFPSLAYNVCAADGTPPDCFLFWFWCFVSESTKQFLIFT